MNKQNRNKLIEHFDGCQMRGRLGVGEKGDRIKKYKFVVT